MIGLGFKIRYKILKPRNKAYDAAHPLTSIYNPAIYSVYKSANF